MKNLFFFPISSPQTDSKPSKSVIFGLLKTSVNFAGNAFCQISIKTKILIERSNKIISIEFYSRCYHQHINLFIEFQLMLWKHFSFSIKLSFSGTRLTPKWINYYNVLSAFNFRTRYMWLISLTLFPEFFSLFITVLSIYIQYNTHQVLGIVFLSVI